MIIQITWENDELVATIPLNELALLLQLSDEQVKVITDEVQKKVMTS